MFKIIPNTFYKVNSHEDVKLFLRVASDQGFNDFVGKNAPIVKYLYVFGDPERYGWIRWSDELPNEEWTFTERSFQEDFAYLLKH